MRVRHVHTSIRPGGGPSGYLHYLRRAVEENPDTGVAQFDFVEIVPPPFVTPPKWRRGLWRMQREIAHVVQTPFDTEFFALIRDLEGAGGWLDQTEAERLFACDLLVAHEAFVAERLVKLCPRLAKAKLVLMTHAPTFLAFERASMADAEGDERELYARAIVQKVMRREMDVMQSVRAVAWPCVEAQEGYPLWHERYGRGEVQVAFAETGVPRLVPRSSPEALRRSWGIEAGQKVALFMGRPHPHKGFDRFVDWADAQRRQGRGEWVFVQAGAKPSGTRDVSPVRHVGYVEDNAAAYLASDLVLIPNRYSYFDIGALETLSLGAKVAMTAVGGHKHLLRACPAIPPIPSGDPAEVWSSLKQIAAEYASGDNRQEAMKCVWASRYSLHSFAANHVTLACQLAEKQI